MKKAAAIGVEAYAHRLPHCCRTVCCTADFEMHGMHGRCHASVQSHISQAFSFSSHPPAAGQMAQMRQVCGTGTAAHAWLGSQLVESIGGQQLQLIESIGLTHSQVDWARTQPTRQVRQVCGTRSGDRSGRLWDCTHVSRPISARHRSQRHQPDGTMQQSARLMVIRS